MALPQTSQATILCSLPAACLLLLGACVVTVAPDPDPDPEYLGPAVIDLSPSPGQDDFYFQDNLWAQFEFAPTAAELVLLDSDEQPVPAATTTSDSGTLFAIDPVDDLQPSTDYTLEIRVTTPDSPPLRVAFSTSAHGSPISKSSGGLWGTVYRLDTSKATVLEPAKAGSLILSQIEDWNVLIGVEDTSEFGDEEQPGVHLQAALAREMGDGYEQDPCGRTASLTWGADGSSGGGDDNPATFVDPRLLLGPADVDFTVGLIPYAIGDLNFEVLFHPELTDIGGGSISGLVDTRAFDMLFPEKGGQDGVTCSLVQAVGIDCIECGEPSPGPYCLNIAIEGLRATRVTIPPLVQHDCSFVIDHWESTGECQDQIDLYDLQPNGSYALCPEHPSP